VSLITWKERKVPTSVLEQSNDAEPEAGTSEGEERRRSRSKDGQSLLYINKRRVPFRENAEPGGNQKLPGFPTRAFRTMRFLLLLPNRRAHIIRRGVLELGRKDTHQPKERITNKRSAMTGVLANSLEV